MESPVNVGIGQLRVGRNPDRIMCVGLGSCVAIALWDHSTKIGGMAHIMLPDESLSPKASTKNPAKFANTAVNALLVELIDQGANRYLTVAKIAGGANMFKHLNPDMKDIGMENVVAVRKAIIKEHLKLVSEDVGGSTGRTVELDTSTGNLLIKNVRGDTKII